MFLRCLGMFLDVLGSFRMFFDVFFYVLVILVRFWTFWDIFGGFAMFLDVLGCFWTFILF